MRYDAYRRQTDRAAAALAPRGAHVVSLAGGYFGIQLPADGAHVIIALDLDSDSGAPPWLAWSEDGHGDRCCDDNAMELGACRPILFHELAERAFCALLAHRH